MSGLSEFQLLAAIRGSEATAAMNEAAGRPKAAAAARKRLRRHRDELRGRLDARLESGTPIPDAFREALS